MKHSSKHFKPNNSTESKAKEEHKQAENSGESNKKSSADTKFDATKSAEYLKLLTDFNNLKKEVGEAREYVKNYKADLDRIKERNKGMHAELTEKVTVEVAKKLLPIIDNFEKSFLAYEDESSIKGFKMIYNQLEKVLDNLKIKKYDVAEDFDPSHMEAIFVEPATTDEQDGKVAKILQNGYFYEPTEKVVRPVMVSVYSKQ